MNNKQSIHLNLKFVFTKKLYILQAYSLIHMHLPIKDHISFLSRIVLSVTCIVTLSRFPVNAQPPGILHFMDSIEQVNKNVHDTVKIQNYIKIYEKLDGKYLDTALYFIDKALKIDSHYASSILTMNLLKFKGTLLKEKHQYTSALDSYLKALTLNKNDINTIQVELFNSIGLLYIEINMMDEAFKNLMEGLNLCDKKNDPEMHSILLNNIGFFHQKREEYIKALDFFQNSLKIQRILNDPNSLALGYNNIGLVYFYIGKYDSALNYYNKALNISIKLNDVKEQAIPLFNIGETYYEINEYEKAKAFIVKSYEIEKEYNGKEGMAIALNFLGKIYAKQNHYAKAFDHYNQALALCLKINNLYELKEVYKNMYHTHKELGQFNKALTYHELYTRVKDSIFNTESNNRIMELEARYQSEQKQAEIEKQKADILQKETELKKQSSQKTSLLIGLVLIVAISVLVYVKLQQRGLQQKQKALLLEQRLLRSQLNPHFIFNTLGAIQNFALQGDPLQMSTYMARFSKLVRTTLEHSGKEFIPFTEEKEFITHFLELQKLRFEDKFSYTLQADVPNAGKILVPPMLAQPFIENSIKHGILPMKKTGEVAIRYSLQHGQMLIEVEDNGIGITESQKNGSNEKGLSFSTRITRERLQLLLKTNQKNLVEITDKAGLGKETPGTLVRLMVPVRYVEG